MFNFSLSDETVQKLLAFRKARDWEKFHTAPNLAKSISIEAAELLELFQWEPPVVDLTKIEHEIADIVIYLTYFCEAADINLDKIVQDKILINDFNYPVENNNGVCNRLKEVVL